MRRNIAMLGRKIPAWALVLMMIASASAAAASSLATPYAEVAVSVSQTVVINDYLMPITFKTYGTGEGSWSTARYHTGRYSGKLYVPASGDIALVKVVTNIRFGDLPGDDRDKINFWAYIESTGPGLGAQLIMILYCDMDYDDVEDYVLLGAGTLAFDGTAPEANVGVWRQYHNVYVVAGDPASGIAWQINKDVRGVTAWTTQRYSAYVAAGFQDDIIIGVAVWLKYTYSSSTIYVDDLKIGDVTFDLENPETLDYYEFKSVGQGQYAKIVVMGQGNDYGWRILRLKNLAGSENIIRVYAVGVPEWIKLKFTTDRGVPTFTKELFEESYAKIPGGKMALINIYLLIEPGTPQGTYEFTVVVEVLGS